MKRSARGRSRLWIDVAFTVWILAVGILYFLQFSSEFDEGLRVLRRMLGLQ